jgi:AraC-like DNA-binding protein
MRRILTIHDNSPEMRERVTLVHTIRATCLLQFKELLGELGKDPDAILRQAGIRPDDAGQADRFVSLRAAAQALEAAAAVTSMPDFGRRLAARRSIETIGLLGVAAQSAPTLEAAFEIFSTFIGAHSPGVQAGLTPESGSSASFYELRLLLDGPPRQCQAIEMGLGASLQILRAMLGSAYSPLAVRVPHSALTPPADYVRYFGCTAHFAQPEAGFLLRAADLRRCLQRDDQTRRQAVAELTALIDGRPPSLVQTVTDVTRTLLPSGALTIDLAAKQLGLHPRTLQRRLATEDASFAALVDNVRRDTAQRYLRDTDISLEHLTRLLGYSEQSVLTRSCQRWFSTSPTGYRSTGARLATGG